MGIGCALCGPKRSTDPVWWNGVFIFAHRRNHGNPDFVLCLSAEACRALVGSCNRTVQPQSHFGNPPHLFHLALGFRSGHRAGWRIKQLKNIFHYFLLLLAIERCQTHRRTAVLAILFLFPAGVYALFTSKWVTLHAHAEVVLCKNPGDS